MTLKNWLTVVFILVLAYVRILLENYLLQLGGSDHAFEGLIRCSFAGCAVKFQYRAVLDVLSFILFFVSVKQFTNLNPRQALLASSIFVVAIMWTNLYGFIPDLLGNLFDKSYLFDTSIISLLISSLNDFIGLSIGVFLFVILIKRKMKHSPS